MYVACAFVMMKNQHLFKILAQNYCCFAGHGNAGWQCEKTFYFINNHVCVSCVPAMLVLSRIKTLSSGLELFKCPYPCILRAYFQRLNGK